MGSPPLSCSTKPDPITPVPVPPTVKSPPPVMGQPDRASAAAPNAMLRNIFTFILPDIFTTSYCDNRGAKSCPQCGEFRVKKCVDHCAAPRTGPWAIHCKLGARE